MAQTVIGTAAEASGLNVYGAFQIGGVEIADSSGNITAPVKMGDLDEIVDANGNEMLEFDTVTSAVNFTRLANAAAGSGLVLSAQGDDTNIPYSLTGKGTGAVILGQATSTDVRLAADQPIADSSGNELVKFVKTTSAVNEITIANAATGAFPTISATGEADTGIDFENSEGEEILKLDAVASAINELTVSNAAASGTVLLEATGGDASIPVLLRGKGTGAVYLGQSTSQGVALVADQPLLDSANNELIKFVATASAVNEITVTNSATGVNPVLSATGGDANIGLTLTPKGTGEILAKTAEAGAVGSVFRLQQKGGSQANSDVVGRFIFTGQDDAATPADEDYARIDVVVTDVTAANPDADMIFYTDVAGTLTERLRLTAASGAVVGADGVAASLSSKGAANLSIQTGSGTGGAITVVDGADGAVNLTPNGVGKVATTRVQATIGLQTTPSAVTATADGLTTGVIAAGTGAVSVTSDNANKIITLPTAVVGNKIMIYLGGTGCELRTVAASNETINTVDSDGTNELALVAAGVFECVCQGAGKWVIWGWTNAGAAIATLVPDAA